MILRTSLLKIGKIGNSSIFNFVGISKLKMTTVKSILIIIMMVFLTVNTAIKCPGNEKIKMYI